VSQCRTCRFWRVEPRNLRRGTCLSFNPTINVGAKFSCGFHQPNVARQREIAILRHFAAVVGLALIGFIGFDVNTQLQIRRVIADDIAQAPSSVAARVEAIHRLTRSQMDQLALVELSMTEGVQHYSRFKMESWSARWHVPRYQDLLDQQQAQGWAQPRADCKGQVIWAAQLLNGLGIKFRTRTSLVLSHAWIEAEVDGMLYDLNCIPATEAESFLAIFWEPLVRLGFERKLRPLPPLESARNLCNEVRQTRNGQHSRESAALGFPVEPEFVKSDRTR